MVVLSRRKNECLDYSQFAWSIVVCVPKWLSLVLTEKSAKVYASSRLSPLSTDVISLLKRVSCLLSIFSSTPSAANASGRSFRQTGHVRESCNHSWQHRLWKTCSHGVATMTSPSLYSIMHIYLPMPVESIQMIQLWGNMGCNHLENCNLLTQHSFR